MASTTAADATSPNPAPDPTSRGGSLRVRAVVVFVLLIVEVLVGNELALAGSPYPLGYLAAHIVLAVLLTGFTSHVLLASIRGYRGSTRIAAGVTFVTTLGALLSGTVFLLAGQSNAALVGMEALAVLALLGAILLMVWGGAGSRRPTSAAS